MTRCKLRNQRPKAFWGALLGGLIPSVFSFAGNMVAAKQQADALRRQQEEQARLARQQNEIAQNNAMARTLNSYADGENIIEEDKYLGTYKLGGKLGNTKGRVLAGGKQVRLTNNTSLLRGLSHGQKNSIGGDGITMKFGNQEIDAQNGEVVYDKNPYEHFIISNAKKLGIGGKSPASLVKMGANPEQVVRLQEINKRRLGIKTSPVEKRWGDYVGTPEYINLGGDVLGAFGNIAANAMLSGVKIDPVLATHTDAVSVSIPEQVKSWGKYRSLARAAGKSIRDINRNTASGNVANSLRQNIASNEAEEYAKLYDSDYEKTLDNIRFNAQNAQQVRLANQQSRNQIALANQQVQMDAAKTNAEIAMTKANNIGKFLGDLSRAGVNFGSQYRQNVNDTDALKAYLGTVSDEAVDRFLSLNPSFRSTILRNWKKNRLNNSAI